MKDPFLADETIWLFVLLAYALLTIMPIFVVAVIIELIAMRQSRTLLEGNIDSPFWWSFLGGLLCLLAGVFGTLPVILLCDRLINPRLIGSNVQQMSGADTDLIIVASAISGAVGAILGSILGGIYGLRRFRRSHRR